MAEIFKEISNIVKESYLPAWDNQLGVTPSAIMQKIKKVTLTSNKIVSAAPIGLNGGFGYGEDGISVPTSGKRMKARFESEARDMYCEIKISDKCIKLAQGKGDSIINELHDEIQGSYEAAEWNVGRSIFGNGTGILARFNAVNGKELTVENKDTRFLKEGLLVDVYESDAVKLDKPAQIVAVDRANGTVTLDTEVSYTAGFLTVQGSYKKEIDGLGAIFDDSIDTIYGLKKSENKILLPVVVDAQEDISDTVLNDAVRRADREKNSKIDMLCCGDAAFDAYLNYLRTNNHRVEGQDLALEGGFKAIRFLFGNREVAVVNEQFVPDNEIWGFDTSKLELHTLKWDFVSKDGSAFTLIPGTSVFRALLSNYGNLICKNPGGCIRIHNVKPAA